MKKIVVFLLALLLLFVPTVIRAQDAPQIDFFYSETCPHCRDEQKFLDNLERDYPELIINRYPVKDSVGRDLLVQKAKEIGNEEILGVVPITFVGNKIFVGYDNEKGIGAKIRSEVESFYSPANPQPELESELNGPIVPILGEIDTSRYSLPILAVVLGFLDGFNVCSLGALALILGLVITLHERKKILIFGGIFIFTTALVYGFLIFFWHKLFELVSGYSFILELGIGILGIVGGYYLFREFLACRKAGPACKFGQIPVVRKVSSTVQRAFSDKADMARVLLAILAFAAVITIVEFPCSAAIPVVFAGLLADANVGALGYLSLIAIFVFFYLLDELVVYMIATTKMTMWLGNPKFTTWAVLIESLLLLGIGTYYLASLLGL